MGRRAPEIPLERFYLHMPEDVMTAARKAARREGLSISRWITKELRAAIYATTKAE